MSRIKSQEKSRILVVDDDPSSQLIVKEALNQEGYQVKACDTGSEALSVLENYQPHLVLLDVNMPGINGLETLKKIRTMPEYISCVFVSGQSDIDDIIVGLDAGADDYICKPFNILELLARVRAQLRIKSLQDQLESANSRLKELVVIDDLTGLHNMRNFYEKLERELARSRRYMRSVAVIMMGMDHFKEVNDSNDHLFGSFVLSEVGKIVKKTVRKIDHAARYGGDEFVVILSEVQLRGALAFCERLRKTIEDFEFKSGESSIKLTCSIGFAISAPGKQMDGKELVKVADKALYDAKAFGRNCVCYYDLSINNQQQAVKYS